MQKYASLIANQAATWDVDQQRRGASFLQSSWWGAFQQQYGRSVHYIQEARWAALVVQQKTPLGSYWLVPYGPTGDTEADVVAAINQLIKLARRAGMINLRIEPKQLFDAKQIKGLRRAAHDLNPRYTVVSDLSKSEDELHKALNSTNRSLVNQIPRNGITYRQSSSPDDIELFLTLQAEVSARTGAKFQPADYFRKQAQALLPAGNMHLYVAFQGDMPVAATITHDYAGTTTYTYAASAYAARKQSVGNTIVWRAMIEAKQRGQRWFDFSGIAGPDAKPDNPWLGFTFFKLKYGGQPAEYMGTWDVPLKPQYHALRWRTAVLYMLRGLKQRRKKKS